ncbi:MAG: aldehyde dehydrogenase (NADP(+)) [Ferruginibacter sp.]
MNEHQQIIGFDWSALGKNIFFSYNPVSGIYNDHSFYNATVEEVDLAAKKSARAFQQYRKKSGVEKAAFLEAIADEILKAGDHLVEICCNETGLPKGRIEGERGRTIGQLKLFAELLKDGSWVDARIDTAMPDRKPAPKPDIRFMNIAIGPVVVFGASNFPLAFSVAGGDTVSALAAGCPVIVKAHAAHPATSAIIGNAIQIAAKNMNMPDGVFSLLFDDGIQIGIELVKHPLIKAVGFTGSFKAGKALNDVALSRPEPIPVYAEMSSTNPVFILPKMMKEHGAAIAAGYSASLTLGVGQFCTNPGLLFYRKTDDVFKALLKNEFEKTNGGTMLTSNILKSYETGLNDLVATAGVDQLATGKNSDENNYATPALMTTDVSTFNQHVHLAEEIFGPVSLAVRVNSRQEMLDIANKLSGHLTATVYGGEDELIEYKNLLEILEQKVGRVIINNFPTGVEVCSAMVHGGPYPATTNDRTTSVGTAAIFRFTRPVCFQNMPQALLPPELQDENPLSISRLFNGKRAI